MTFRLGLYEKKWLICVQFYNNKLFYLCYAYYITSHSVEVLTTRKKYMTSYGIEVLFISHQTKILVDK